MRDTQTTPKKTGNICPHKLDSNRVYMTNAHMKQTDGTESLSKYIQVYLCSTFLKCVELELCYVCVNLQTV